MGRSMERGGREGTEHGRGRGAGVEHGKAGRGAGANHGRGEGREAEQEKSPLEPLTLHRLWFGVLLLPSEWKGNGVVTRLTRSSVSRNNRQIS